MTSVAIVDYGLGNLFSVQRAFRSLGAEAEITANPADLSGADSVVVPGVGAFGEGMRNLESRGLAPEIQALARAGKPTLGICLGMQLLMDESEELGPWKGLGLVPGRVAQIRITAGSGTKVPQIGWNDVEPPAGRTAWSNPLMDGIEPGSYMYFVHSYAVIPADQADLVAETQYADTRFCSVFARANVVGCQFHPEKSADVGLRLIGNFLRWVERGASA